MAYNPLNESDAQACMVGPLADFATLTGRVTALESATPTPSSLASRIGSLETWRGAKAATLSTIANISTIATVDVLGISLIVGGAASSIQAKINELAAGHNDIKAKLTAREITL